MKKIVLSSTSFLLPRSSAWKALSSICQLSFSEYGDLTGGGAVDGYSCVVINAQDVIGLDVLNDADLENKINLFINVFKMRLSSASSPLLVGITKGKLDSIVAGAKSPSVLDKFMDNLFLCLRNLQNNYNQLYLLNLDLEFSKFGFNSVFDSRNWYFSRCRYSKLGLNLIADSFASVINRINYSASKVLVLDCDNTLWGGVVGEDGVEGIVLGQDGIGQVFVDFQKVIKNLADQGVILVLSSKNNESDVWDVFDNHPSMILRKNNIVTWKIDWNEKSQNIRKMSTELDLGLDSFVFWDDNPVERAKVKEILPEVYTVEPPDDLVSWPAMLSNLSCFQKYIITTEDAAKTDQYKSRAKFIRDINVQATPDDLISYLKSIRLEPCAIDIDDYNISRAEQLCAKTNQYNLRTQRHTAADIRLFNKDLAFLASLKDLYGDHGIVALVCLEKLNKKSLFVDTLLMSCRILGRHLESWLLNEILQRARRLECENVIFEYIPTKKNSVAMSFFDGYDDYRIDPEMTGRVSVNSIFYSFPVDGLYINFLEIYEKEN